MYRFYFNCHRWKPTREQWLFAYRCLAANELKRIDEYAFQRDAKFSLVGQLLIRYLLTQVFRQKSSTFKIQRTQNNRPYIQTDSSFDFNLSHRDQLVCIAGSFDGPIGCDTMLYRTKEVPKINHALVRKKFTFNEYEYIAKDPSNFNRLWCLKESYVKWTGTGVGFQLLRLNFHIKTKEFSKEKSIISDTVLELDSKLISDTIRFDEQVIFLSDNQQQLITLCLPMNNTCQSFVELNIDDILHGCTPFDENKQDDLTYWERFQMKRQTDII